MATTAIVGNTYRFKLTATKDGSVWDLTAATIKLFLKDPSGVTTTKTGSILVAGDGTAYYDSSASDLDAAGRWERSWEITQSGIIQEGAPIVFYVQAAKG